MIDKHLNADVIKRLNFEVANAPTAISLKGSCDGCALLQDNGCTFKYCAAGIGLIVLDPNNIGIKVIERYYDTALKMDRMHT
jgi:hypothetical protein